MKNKSKFVSLRRFLPILSFILFTAVLANGQDNRMPASEIQAKVLKTYPNPATTYIVFDFQKGYEKGLTIVVYNFLGRKMYENPNASEKTTLTLTDFNRGIYIYHVTDQSGKVIDTGKFQVSR